MKETLTYGSFGQYKITPKNMKMKETLAYGSFGQYKITPKNIKMKETLTYGHSSVKTQGELSNKCQHDRV